MFARAFLVLFMLIASMTFAVYPDSSHAGSPHTACALSADPEHLHQYASMKDMNTASVLGKRFLDSCCDNGCLLDLTLSNTARPITDKMTRAFSQWSASNLADLTDPYGFRRPPRV